MSCQSVSLKFACSVYFIQMESYTIPGISFFSLSVMFSRPNLVRAGISASFHFWPGQDPAYKHASFYLPIQPLAVGCSYLFVV